MACRRCVADPQPSGEGWTFGSPRGCAFDDDGQFTHANWNCATIEALLDFRVAQHFGSDESLDLIPFLTDVWGRGYAETDGWIVLTRYKRRGKTSSAVRVGDWWPAQPLTLADAESALDILTQQRTLVAPAPSGATEVGE